MKSNKIDDIENKKEGNDMEAVLNDRSGYRRLDMSKLKFSDKPMSMEESLKDIIPIHWSGKEVGSVTTTTVKYNKDIFLSELEDSLKEFRKKREFKTENQKRSSWRDLFTKEKD